MKCIFMDQSDDEEMLQSPFLPGDASKELFHSCCEERHLLMCSLHCFDQHRWMSREMKEMLAGIEMDVKLMQSRKDSNPIDATPSLILTFFESVHPEKVDCSDEETEPGIMMDSILEQSLSVEPPIDVIEEGIVMSFNLLHLLKHSDPMELTLEGIDNDSKLMHRLNAELPIDVTEEEMDTDE